MKSALTLSRSFRRSFWLASLAAAGLLPLGAAGLRGRQGTVNLSGFQTIISSSNAGDRLMIGSSATIASVGNVGEGRTTFTNNGAV